MYYQFTLLSNAMQMFFSTHYAGSPLIINLRDGEPWKKVFGPVFIYLNSVSDDDDPLTLWADAKEQVSPNTFINIVCQKNI